MDYITHGKVAQVLADVALEEWPLNTDKFIGSAPASQKICNRVGIGNQLIVNMVETLLYRAYTDNSK